MFDRYDFITIVGILANSFHMRRKKSHCFGRCSERDPTSETSWDSNGNQEVILNETETGLVFKWTEIGLLRNSGAASVEGIDDNLVLSTKMGI